jgi:hypothetical protein
MCHILSGRMNTFQSERGIVLDGVWDMHGSRLDLPE